MPTPLAQRLSRTLYTTDGTTTVWDFAFSDGYLDAAHVKARVDTPEGLRTELVVTPLMLVGEFQLEITPALAAGDVLTIYRDTPKDAPLVNFTDESGFSEIALDTNARQAVMVAAETADEVNTSDIGVASEAAIAAATSATAAMSSQTAAASSAVVANSAKIAAEAALDSFDDRYLGAKADDPALDNDGAALLTGALYWNTVANELRVYTGAGWLDAGSVTASVPVEYTFNGTGAQTAFALGTAPASSKHIFVRVGGVYQEASTYTLVGLTLTFSEAPPAGTGNVDVMVFTLPTFADASGIAYQAAGAGAGIITVQAKLRESVSVKDFGAVGDGVTDDSAAYLLAVTWLNAAQYRTLEGVQGESYKITQTLQITQDSATFNGNGCLFINAITNKTPLFKLSDTVQQSCTLENFTVTGSGTPGHVVSIFGDVAGSPSFITLSNVHVFSNTGTGLNSASADVPSHFVWMEGGMTLRMSNCKSYVTGGGVHLLNVQKVLLESTSIDGCTADRTLHVEGCRNVVIGDDCVFNSSYNDQCYFTGNTSVSINGNRFKGGNGRMIYADGANSSFAVENNNFEVYSLTTSAVVIGTGTNGASVRGNNFSLINSGGGTTFAEAVIDVVSTGAVVSYSGEISNNVITVNNLLTLTAGIRLYASSNSIRGWKVENNKIGNAATSAVVTTGIVLSGTQFDTRVIGNTLGMSGSGCSMTTGISIGASVTGAVVMGTQQDGTVTTLIADSGVKTIRESGGVWEPGTFTPAVYGGTSPGSGTYSIQMGKYSKIGNLVFYSIALSWTGHTGTGDLRISGLPFAASSTANQIQVGNCLASNLTFSGQLVAYPSGGTTFMRVGNFSSGGAFAFTAMDAAADLYITGVYEIA